MYYSIYMFILFISSHARVLPLRKCISCSVNCIHEFLLFSLPWTLSENFAIRSAKLIVDVGDVIEYLLYSTTIHISAPVLLPTYPVPVLTVYTVND